MSQEHEDIKCTYPWYFYFGFVFLMMFRMAKYFLHFSTKFLISITKFLVVFLHDGFQWILWWSRLMFLLLLYYAGWLSSPLYFNLFFIFDVELMTVGHKRGRRPFLRTLDCRNCVFTEVINISGDSLAYLRRSIMNFSRAYANILLTFWQSNRDKLGTFPPNGWPMKLTLGLFLLGTYFFFIIIGYFKVVSAAIPQWFNSIKTSFKKLFHRWCRKATTVIPKTKPSFDLKRIKTVLQTVEEASNISAQLFDSDSNELYSMETSKRLHRLNIF